MAFRTPMFYKYYAQTYRVDSTPDGGLTGTILDLDTGLFREDNSHIREVIWSTTESDIRGPFSEERFVQETERERDHYLTGDGPIFALYETVGGLYEQARKRESRKLEPQELALVQSIYKRTFKMWEDEAARRAAGEPPSFEARRKHPIRPADPGQ